jgi:hypothetical protein
MIKSTDYIEDLVRDYPGLNAFLMKKGLRCMTCGEPVWGTLGELIQSKGLDVEPIVAEVNEEFKIDKNP